MENKYNIIKISIYIILFSIMIMLVGGVIHMCVLHYSINQCTQNVDTAEYIAKVHSALGEGSLTFLITLIVALLVALLVNRTTKIDDLIVENRELKNWVNDYITTSVVYDTFLTKIESVYNIALMSYNISELVNTGAEKDYKKLKELCSQVLMPLTILKKNIQDGDLSFVDEKSQKTTLQYVENTIHVLHLNTTNEKDFSIVGNLSSRITILLTLLNDTIKSGKLCFQGEEAQKIVLTYIDDTMNVLNRTEYILEKEKNPIAEILEELQEEIKEFKNEVKEIPVRKARKWN